LSCRRPPFPVIAIFILGKKGSLSVIFHQAVLSLKGCAINGNVKKILPFDRKICQKKEKMNIKLKSTTPIN